MDTVVKGHAKINWKLEVLGPFPDQHPNAGFTELRSVISLIELHDRVRIQCERDESGSVRIHSNHPDVPQTANQRAEHNVCFKAIQALRKHFPELCNYAFEIQIEKNLPLAGGLGGSSTDGAALLRAAVDLLSLDLNRKELLELAATFGSDTPFFATGDKLALIEGRGERVTTLTPPPTPAHLVLLNPRRELTVSEVFGSLTQVNPTENESLARRPALLKRYDSIQELTNLSHNDLEQAPYVKSSFPELPEIKSTMCNAGCTLAQMSGSGATVFGVCSTAQHAASVAAALRDTFPLFDVLTSATLI